jgi:hypothetical protein
MGSRAGGTIGRGHGERPSRDGGAIGCGHGNAVAGGVTVLYIVGTGKILMDPSLRATNSRFPFKILDQHFDIEFTPSLKFSNFLKKEW